MSLWRSLIHPHLTTYHSNIGFQLRNATLCTSRHTLYNQPLEKTRGRLFTCSAREVFGHIESVKIIVILNPTGYMLTSSGFDAFINLRYILWIPLKWRVILQKSWTSTGYSLNSTGSSATNRRFFPDMGLHVITCPCIIKIWHWCFRLRQIWGDFLGIHSDCNSSWDTEGKHSRWRDNILAASRKSSLLLFWSACIKLVTSTIIRFQIPIRWNGSNKDHRDDF